jgi:two-component system nitrogen regulation sensor histidine kinase GlnL
LLVRGLAHEIKNPLGGLRGAAQLLARELDSEHLTDYTNVIIAEADRLRNLVDRLLSAPRNILREPLNIHEVLERVRHLVEAETQGRLHIQRDYDPSIPEFHGDREQLIQAVLNITRNAQQALDSQRNTGNSRRRSASAPARSASSRSATSVTGSCARSTSVTTARVFRPSCSRRSSCR